MSIGLSIRKLFGKHERKISDLYRSLYIDINELCSKIQLQNPEARRILEIGCGEGVVTEKLSSLFPSSEIIGIDISDNIGRQFKPQSGNVKFYKLTVEEYLANYKSDFDIVILSDVLHHIPDNYKSLFITNCRKMVKNGGKFFLKEYVFYKSFFTLTALFADRYLTGDRYVSFFYPHEFKNFVLEHFSSDAISDSFTIRPRKNNMAYAITII